MVKTNTVVPMWLSKLPQIKREGSTTYVGLKIKIIKNDSHDYFSF